MGVYGFPKIGNIDEDCPLKFTNEYERTKLIGEKIVIDELKNTSMYTILRPGPIIHHKMKNNYVLSLIKYIDTGKFFFIGHQKTIFNYVDVINVIDALKHIIKNNESKNQIFNLCDQIYLDEMVNSIKVMLGNKKKIFRIPYIIARVLCYIELIFPNFPLTFRRLKVLTNLSSFKDTKIKKILEFKKKRSFDQTIKDFILEYKD